MPTDQPHINGPSTYSGLQLLHSQKPTIPSTPDPNVTLSEVLFRSLWQFNPLFLLTFCPVLWAAFLPSPALHQSAHLEGSRRSQCGRVQEASEDVFVQFNSSLVTAKYVVFPLHCTFGIWSGESWYLVYHSQMFCVAKRTELEFLKYQISWLYTYNHIQALGSLHNNHPHNSTRWVQLISSFYRWTTWSAEKAKNLSKVTQPASSRAGLHQRAGPEGRLQGRQAGEKKFWWTCSVLYTASLEIKTLSIMV